jgi:hypothetical protein
MEDIMQVVKINKVDNTVKWNYQYIRTVGLVAGDEWGNKKIPGHFHQDPSDNSRLYLLGQWQQRAMIMKFAKKNMNLDWKLEIKDANN